MLHLEKSMKLYETLGLAQKSTVDEVKRAYREKALLYHPDKNPGDALAAEKFKEVAAAYQVLGDQQKKSAYDARLASSLSSSGSFTPRGDSFRGRADSFNAAGASLNDELRRFRAERRASSSARAAKKPEPAASQYSEEQNQLFRQRAKERERELVKKREKEREEMREREVNRLKKLQDDRRREEERKQREAAKARERLDKILLDSSQRAPRLAKEESVSKHDEKLERLRVEREKQEEWRRKEQERMVEKKLNSLREAQKHRESEIAEEEKEVLHERIRILEQGEHEDRHSCIAIEESHERGIIIRSFFRVKIAHEFACEQRELCGVEFNARRQIEVDQVILFVQVELAGLEDCERAKLERDHRVVLTQMNLQHARDLSGIVERQRQRGEFCFVESRTRSSLEHREFFDRKLVDIDFSEIKERLHIVESGMLQRNGIMSRFSDGATRVLVGTDELRERRYLEELEEGSWLLMKMQARESLFRLELVQHEDQCRLLLIHRRADAMSGLLIDMANQSALMRVRYDEQSNKEKSLLGIEVGELTKRLQLAQEELELLRNARSTPPASTAPQPPSVANVAVQCIEVPGVDVSSQASLQSPSRSSATQSVPELPVPEAASGAGESKELITLLCSENRRLLATNAKLVEENWRLARNAERGAGSPGSFASVERRTTSWVNESRPQPS